MCILKSPFLNPAGGGGGGRAGGAGWPASAIQEGGGLHRQPHREGMAQGYWGAMMRMFICFYGLLGFTCLLVIHSFIHMLFRLFFFFFFHLNCFVSPFYLFTYFFFLSLFLLTLIHLLVIIYLFLFIYLFIFHASTLLPPMNSLQAHTCTHPLPWVSGYHPSPLPSNARSAGVG